MLSSEIDKSFIVAVSFYRNGRVVANTNMGEEYASCSRKMFRAQR